MAGRFSTDFVFDGLSSIHSNSSRQGGIRWTQHPTLPRSSGLRFPKSVVPFGGGRQMLVARVIVTVDLSGLYAVACHSKFQGRDCPFPIDVADPRGYATYPFH